MVAASALGIGGIAASAVVATGASADTVPVGTLPATVSADALPTVQINGVAWSQVTVGNTVYVTGSFSQARPAGVAVGGAGSVARSNLLAYDITTGKLITTFNHSLNGQGLAIVASPNGSTVYVVGDFTKVDGVTHNRIAAFSTATGNLISTFTGNLNGSTKAVTANNSTVYVGGSFRRPTVWPTSTWPRSPQLVPCCHGTHRPPRSRTRTTPTPVPLSPQW